MPLTPAVFHILLALVGQERHGYDIMQQVKSDSQGAVKMGPGTLYGSLDRMIDAGLVAKGNTQDPRRIYYKLTALGHGDAQGGNGAAVASCRCRAPPTGDRVIPWRAAGEHPSRSLAVYGFLLRMYAPDFLARHRAEMLQNFEDLENASSSTAALWCS